MVYRIHVGEANTGTLILGIMAVPSNSIEFLAEVMSLLSTLVTSVSALQLYYN